MLHVGNLFVMLLTGEFPGTEGLRSRDVEGLLHCLLPFSSGLLSLLSLLSSPAAILKTETRALLVHGCPWLYTDIVPRGQKVSIIPALSGNSKPRDIAYQPNKQNKTNTSRCHENHLS